METKLLSNTYLLRFLNFLLFGNIYVAFGAVCLVQSTCIQLQLTGHLIAYSSLVFFGTLFVYNFQRLLYKDQKNSGLNSIRRQWIFDNQSIIKLFTIIGFTGVVIAFCYNDFKVIYYLSPLLLLSLAYFSPIIKLRKSPFLKLFTLVFVWTTVTTIVPILLNDLDVFTINNLLHISISFCFMMAICIPFDLRDLEVDAADNVSTLPNLIGENKAKQLALAFILLYITLIFPEYFLGVITYKIFIALLFSAVINLVIVFMSNSMRNEYYYVALLDGTMILQGVMLIMVEFFL